MAKLNAQIIVQKTFHLKILQSAEYDTLAIARSRNLLVFQICCGIDLCMPPS